MNKLYSIFEETSNNYTVDNNLSKFIYFFKNCRCNRFGADRNLRILALHVRLRIRDLLRTSASHRRTYHIHSRQSDRSILHNSYFLCVFIKC